MLHINAQEDTKRRRQALTELAVAISSAEADLAVHEASASAAEVHFTKAKNDKPTSVAIFNTTPMLTLLSDSLRKEQGGK